LFLVYNISARAKYKKQILYCMRIHCRWDVFTEPLPRNGNGISARLKVVASQQLNTLQY
jgi:hypothetical protein